MSARNLAASIIIKVNENTNKDLRHYFSLTRRFIVVISIHFCPASYRLEFIVFPSVFPSKFAGLKGDRNDVIKGCQRATCPSSSGKMVIKVQYKKEK